MTVELASVSAPPLAGVTATLDSGTHVVLGAPADGTAVLVALISGAIGPRSGRLSVSGADPRRTPAIRRRIRSLLDVEELIPKSTVIEAVRAALELGESSADPQAVLSELGLGRWAARRVKTLSARERRSVALSIALAPGEPAAVVLFEPLSDVPGTERANIQQRIHELSIRAVVVCATASVRDALELGGTTRVLHRGRIARELRAPTAPELAPRESFELAVRCDKPRELAAALAADTACIAVGWNDRQSPGELSLRGSDLAALAMAVARAARSTGARLTALAPELPSVEEVRAASAGVARAAYEEAYRVAQEQARLAAAAHAPPAAAIIPPRTEP